MQESAFAKFFDKYINDTADDGVKAELKCIKAAFDKAASKKCCYCKWVGHVPTDCPVYKEIKSRCVKSDLREKIRGRISSDLGIAARKPLSDVLLKKRH